MTRLHILRGFASPPERTTRTLRIWLPDAARDPSRRFPLLLAQDGQNLFDRPDSEAWPPWGLDSALELLIGRGEIEPWIVVGVDHRGPERIGDFSPWTDPDAGAPANAARYGAFVVEHLLPHLRRSLPVRSGPESTALLGSSLGGLVSLDLGWKHPELFGRIGALSPSVMWAGRRMFAQWDRKQPIRRLYLDAGERELFEAGRLKLDYGRATRDFGVHLRGLGYSAAELKTVLDPAGEHTEADWRRRLPDALRWVLG